jgi:RNA polymerase sigma-70 factor (ECF subfamily)
MPTPADQVLAQLLVLRCQDGDAGALDELVRRWHARLLRHAWHLTGRADAAADVTQESWIAIVRGVGRLHDPAVFRAWAYRIVTHKCADWLRRRRDDRQIENVADELPGDDAARPEQRDEARRLNDAMRRLGLDQRAILSLRYWEDMSIADMADVLGVPEGTVKSRLNQARNELKAILERSSP